MFINKAICRTFIQYFDYDVYVQLKQHIESPTVFPAITICNLNPFDLTNDENSTAFFTTMLLSAPYNPIVAPRISRPTIAHLKDMNTFMKAFINAEYDNEEDRKNTGFSIEKMLISCRFNSRTCTVKDFFHSWNFEYGNCYTFNSIYIKNSTVRKTSKFGPKTGLVLELFVGVPGFHDYYSTQSGVFVVVHNNSVVPGTNTPGFKVRPGTAANIGVTRIFHKKLGSPYSDCRKDTVKVKTSDSNYYRLALEKSQYSRDNCYEHCFDAEIVKKKCNCSLSAEGFRCRTLVDMRCLNIQRAKLEFDNILGEMCDKYCPLECDSIEFNININQASYPTEFYANVLQNDQVVINKFEILYPYEAAIVDFSDENTTTSYLIFKLILIIL
jgi:hypothetical protein